MLWALYALLSGFFWATADVFTKKIHDADNHILILSRFLFAAPMVLLLLFFIPIPDLDINFWLVLIIAIPFEVAAWIFYIKAIRNSHLSLVAPFLTLTPVFLIFTSFVILNELPTIIGFFGILLVVIGTYTLNLREKSKGVLGPVRFIFNEKGCLHMITAAFLFSITSAIGKILVLKSSPLFISAIYLPSVVVPLLIIVIFTSRKSFGQLKSNFNNFFFTGLFFGLMMMTTALALPLAIVPYIISIKRTSSIFGVLYGYFIFKEEYIKERLVGAVIMLVGAGLIILF
ncbi:hypothetical protein CL615_02270 [archaeon]|jgi:drug/metabolite transporter (DMT)-like permease|nr:hypothetical protein [archaeon]MDP6547701.1 EamA family transporter [Candidatus Woesearchaeota archaeon]|tara:strand:- start:1696 stop:2556 length:861 start_codon:yes stop_codon:yes gene_type:complete